MRRAPLHPGKQQAVAGQRTTEKEAVQAAMASSKLSRAGSRIQAV